MAGVTAPSPSSVLSASFGRAFDVAVVIIVAGWQVDVAAIQLLENRTAYPTLTPQVAAWIVLSVAAAISSIRLLRGASGRAWDPVLAVTALAVATTVALACPHGALLKTDWAWVSAGWVGLAALLRRPLAELCSFLAACGLATFSVLAADGLDRLALAGYITVLAGSVCIQLAVAVAARALNATAREAADVVRREASAQERAEVEAVLDEARQARWLSLRQSAEPLISELAAGTADPGDANVRRRCAVEAARLRRLMAEADRSPGPLLHELQACAVMAERRGVAVDVETAGSLPGVPLAARRAITDLAIRLLAGARSHVRITLTPADKGVAVSLVADMPEREVIADADHASLPDGAGELTVGWQRDDPELWMEARWSSV